MGAVFSGLVAGAAEASNETTSGSTETSLGDLPENCVALILSHLEPTEVCGLARVSPTFRRASSSDAVWEPKLPPNYQSLVKNLFDHQTAETLLSSSKKEIFARLCRPTRFGGGGYKQVWLEKDGRGICVSISWKEMKITGIDDRRYWNHISDSYESRFSTIAYLKQIWWVEVEGSLELEFPAGVYSLFFRLHVGKPSKNRGRRTCEVEQVHGWNMKPVWFQLWTSQGQHISCEYYLNDRPAGKWTHYHVGDFVVEESHPPTTTLNFSMTQIDCTHTKGGLCLDSVFICPSKLAHTKFKLS